MIAELPGQIHPCPVDLVGGGAGVHRREQAPGDGDIAGRGKADHDRSLGEERRDAVWSMRIGLQLVATLPVCGSALLEFAEPGAAAAEFFRDGSHSRSRVIDGFIDVGGQSAAVDRDLP